MGKNRKKKSAASPPPPPPALDKQDTELKRAVTSASTSTPNTYTDITDDSISSPASVDSDAAGHVNCSPSTPAAINGEDSTNGDVSPSNSGEANESKDLHSKSVDNQESLVSYSPSLPTESSQDIHDKASKNSNGNSNDEDEDDMDVIMPKGLEQLLIDTIALNNSMSQPDTTLGLAPISIPQSIATPSSTPASSAVLSNHALMIESGKLLEHLRKEIYKLRSQNSQLKNGFASLQSNNQRLIDANASLSSTFDALNHHAKSVSKANAKLKSEVKKVKKQMAVQQVQSQAKIDKLLTSQMELREESENITSKS